MKRILSIILAIIIVIIIVSLIIAPSITRNYIVKNSPELVGRQISLDKLKVNYFRMSVNLIDFVLYEEDGETPFVSFDQLYVNLQPWYLLSLELVIQELLLDGMKVNVLKYDSTFNFDSMIDFLKNDKVEINDSLSVDTVENEPYRFHLSNLELQRGEFYYLDTTVGEDINMVNLNLFVPYIGWNQEDTTDAGLKFFFANGGFFESSFQMDPVTGRFDAEMTIDKLDLGTLLGYATRHMAIDTLSGALDTYLRASGNTNYIDSIRIEGWADLVGLDITSNGHRDLASIDSLYCSLEQLQPLLNRYLIDSLKIVQPNFSLELYDSTNNLSLLFDVLAEYEDELTEIADTSGQNEENTGPPLYYSMNSLELINGTMNLWDYQYADTFYYALTNIDLAVDSITSDANWLDAGLTMTLNDKGKIAAQLGFDPTNPIELDLEYSISEFRLSDLNIYTNNFTGHDIMFGQLYYNSDTRIRSGQIESENKLTIRDIEINKIGGGLMTLPLKLALFFITDKNGDAVLSIPVRGDLNDPQLTIGKLVWDTFKKFILKVVSSPFRFLADLVSADPGDLESIEYVFADTAFTNKIQRQLDLLLELEQKKDGLDIQLLYFVDKGLEKQELCIQQARMKFMKESGKDPVQHEKEFHAYVLQQAGSDTLEVADAALMIISHKEVDSLVEQFSRYRIEQLSKYLKLQNDSSNIRVYGYHADAPKNVGAYPYFKVEYAIVGSEDEE